MRNYYIALVAILGVLASATATASDPADAAPPASPWRLGVAVGYGERSNPLALSDDITIAVDLDIAWFGKRWFFDNGDLGITLLDRDRYTLNLVGRFNSDRVFFGKTNSEIISVFNDAGQTVMERIAIPDRDYAGELGFEFLADGRWGYLQVAAHHDVSNTHDGYELYANYGYAVRKQRWLFEPSFGVSWKSENLNDYYWGVREGEANSVFPAHSVGEGLNRHTRVLMSYQISKHWAFVSVVEYERINSEAAASPIVEQDHVFGAFAGLKYGF